MTKRLSDVFGISHQSVVDAGAFDPFIDVDAPFYVDPFLLRISETHEMQGAEDTFRDYFTQVILLLKSSQRRGDVLYRRATRLLEFPEVKGVHLGYSKGESGSGIGLGLARAIAATAEEIVTAGIENPTIFEIVGLLEEGVGADRVSDMTVRVILDHLLDFSERVARDLGLPATRTDLGEGRQRLPWMEGMRYPAILVPMDLLCHLPVAKDWSDIDHVCAENDALRNRVNPIIGSTWKEAVQDHAKSQLREAVLSFPDVLRDLLGQYERKTARPYNFEQDPAGLLEWFKAKEIASQHPLDLVQYRTDTAEGIYDIARRICERFRSLVEDQRINRLFLNDDGSPRKEKYAQLTFYVVAEQYCAADDLDISPEADAGVGPVDFKVSHGAAAKVTIEVKYSHNSHLLQGYKTQLPAYNRAENTNRSIYLVIRTTQSESQIERLFEIHDEREGRGERVPEIIVVDGRLAESASRRR